ncbi:uncharacterized protein EDB91DRAFT_1235712 [Suillus paluster]|uniref:uncharacterized protein n=1 Tax=Suillus paluster TaxID=48578 RepID=UPI001B8760E9|nr:uncharacterized protein EDB91DRAFT_1235712 [Suillus paluster]KAG1748380.1 hypothetical protein EDB91DRAFT_1235712 [Suillus paluster]
MPSDPKHRTCLYCDKSYHRQGFKTHENACQKRSEQNREDVELARRIRQVYHFEDYKCGPGASTVPPEADPEPWRPFRTCIDFEVAELAHEAALTHKQTDRLIGLIHHSKYELCSLVQIDSRLYPIALSFTKEEVIAPFQGVDQTFLFFHHSLWDWAVDLLQDREVGLHFVFDAQQLSKFNGEKFVRFIHEPWTASTFWEYQSKIPPDAKPLAFILYADKAKLSSFGRVKGYPVVTRCTNLPAIIRNGEGLGGGRVVGWLPIVKEDKKHSGKPAFINFKNTVWHTSFLKLLACLAPLSKLSSPIKCWDDIVRLFYPIILILSADYEEQVVMALIRGLMGKFPCPICLMPREELSKTYNVYRLCTSIDAKAEQILSSESLRDVDNSFDTIDHTDVHRTLSFDKLHFNDEGMFDHLWMELQKWIASSGRQAAVLIDSLQISSFESFPRWQNLNHFDQVVSVSFSDGTKYKDISKLIVFAVHNVFKHDLDPQAYLLLRCLQSYVEFNTCASLEVHTKDTIKDGRNALSELTELMDTYIEDTADLSEKSWNFPKKHLSAHVFDDIKAKGVMRNYNTKPNEKMHGPLKNAYQDRTNFKNFAEQILRYNHDSLVAEYIRSKMDSLNTQNIGSSDLPDLSEANEVEQTKPTDAQHFTLGSRQATISFADIEAGHAGNPAFDRFRIKLNEFLNRTFTANNIPFPSGRRVQLAAGDMITEFRFIKVNYESLVDWRVSMDYLRCNPMFHGLPRYDCVILQTEAGAIFTKLLLIFTCTVGDVQYPIALTLPYDQPVGARPRKDKHFKFWWVKAKPRASAECFSVQSIVRGCVLAEDSTRPNEFLVVDTIDTDMFLWMKEIRTEAGY